MTWEYMTLPASRSFWTGGVKEGALQDQLNTLGAAGWELVTVLQTNVGSGRTFDAILIFKRPQAAS